MVEAREGITEALRQLQESVHALDRTIQPFLEGLLFTPRRSEVVEAMFREFDRARDAYHEALRLADRSYPHAIEE